MACLSENTAHKAIRLSYPVYFSGFFALEPVYSEGDVLLLSAQ